MNSSVISAYYSKEKFRITNHYHDCHQLIYVTDGHINITINRKNITVKKNTLVFLNRLTEHSINEASSDYKRYVLKISPHSRFLPALADKLFFCLFSDINSLSVVDIPKGNRDIASVLDLMISEFSEKNMFDNAMCDYLFSQFLILVCRMHPEICGNMFNENYHTIRDIQLKFETNPENHYTLDELAREYNLSISSLSHKFKNLTGLSVIEYLKHVRIANAKRLLTISDISVSEIVEQCGFTDASNFSRTFKEITGFTPTKFRTSFSK